MTSRVITRSRAFIASILASIDSWPRTFFIGRIAATRQPSILSRSLLQGMTHPDVSFVRTTIASLAGGYQFPSSFTGESRMVHSNSKCPLECKLTFAVSIDHLPTSEDYNVSD